MRLYRLVIVLSFLLVSLNVNSQTNEDDINSLSIFSEYVKAKNYDAAYEPWMELRERNPKFNSAIFVYGERILKYKIKAPFDGSLINTSITQGTLVKFGQKLGEYIDPSIFELEVSVPSQYSNFLKIGKKINYNSVFNKNHTGEIIRINNSIDKSTQTISVFVEFKSIDLKEGMYCEVDIPMKSEDNSYSISRSLLIDNDKIFYVKDDLTLDLITVQKIFFDKKNVIVKGIPDGINILSKQISGAYPGMQVKITN